MNENKCLIKILREIFHAQLFEEGNYSSLKGLTLLRLFSHGKWTQVTIIPVKRIGNNQNTQGTASSNNWKTRIMANRYLSRDFCNKLVLKNAALNSKQENRLVLVFS